MRVGGSGTLRREDKIMNPNYDEADEISPEDLTASATMFDALADGTFYEQEAAAVAWLRGDRAGQ
jgi:hypothetical protein